MEGVLLFLFRLGSPLLMAVGQGSLFGPILSEVVVDPVPELVRQVLLFQLTPRVLYTCLVMPLFYFGERKLFDYFSRRTEEI